MKPNSPIDIPTLLSDAVTAHRQGNLKLAATGYERVLNAEPDHPVATQLLGTVALQTLDYGKARELLTKAISLDAENGTTFHNLARLDEAQGKLQDAVMNYRRALGLVPDNPDTSFSLANVLTSLGQLEESEHWYRKTISIDPAYAPAHRQIARLLDHATVDSDVTAMEVLFETDGIDNSSKLQLAFGLGKAYEDMHDYDKAFAYFNVANQLKRAQLRFNIANWDMEIDKVIRVFSPKLFAQFRNEGRQEARPIFILGMPRSGTSLVEQILASHSQVFGGGELQILTTAIMEGMNVARFPSNVSELTSQAIAKMADAYLDRTSEISSGAAYVTDKKPDNFKLIGMIRLMFPGAKIIHCCRDPLDNCVSLYKNHFSDNGPFYSYDQTELGKYYRGYTRLMQHWRDVLPDFVCDIHYESLVMNLEPGTRELLNYCGLDFEPACLEFHRTSRSVRTASAVQVRKPIYSSSVALWRRYESHLAPLITALAEQQNELT